MTDSPAPHRDSAVLALLDAKGRTDAGRVDAKEAL